MVTVFSIDFCKKTQEFDFHETWMKVVVKLSSVSVVHGKYCFEQK
jgi:hypothetical protein